MRRIFEIIKGLLLPRVALLAPIGWPHVWLHLPIFTYQAILWLFAPSWSRAALAAIALLFDMFLFSTSDGLVSIWENAHLMRFLELFRDYRVARFPLEDLLTKHADKIFNFVYHPENFQYIADISLMTTG